MYHNLRTINPAKFNRRQATVAMLIMNALLEVEFNKNKQRPMLQITVIGWIKCVSNLIGLLS